MKKNWKHIDIDCSSCDYQVDKACRRFPPIRIKVEEYKSFSKKKTYHYKTTYPLVHIDQENAWSWMSACAEYKLSKGDLTNDYKNIS